jgi:hypothetical protein
VRAQLLEFARDLVRFSRTRALAFFSRMMTDPMTGERLRRMMALMRGAIVHRARSPAAALHAPISTSVRDDGFPLHCDLFRTGKLLLVFREVTPGSGGRAVFLRVEALVSAMRRIPTIPRDVVDVVVSLVRAPRRGDAFDRFFDLLYGEERPWRLELGRRLRGLSSEIKLESGEGYLLDDRAWLHGRTPLRGPVTTRRFERLTFGR